MKKQPQDVSSPAVEGYSELGQLVRQLHEPCMKWVRPGDAKRVGELPDTQDRSTTSRSSPNRPPSGLSAPWKSAAVAAVDGTEALALAENGAANGDGDWRRVAEKMQAFLESLPDHTRETSSQLTEIMMAQDFQDLTGQVIKKVIHMAQNLEHQLVHILLISKPADEVKTGDEALLNGRRSRSKGHRYCEQPEEVDDLLNQPRVLAGNG